MRRAYNRRAAEQGDTARVLATPRERRLVKGPQRLRHDEVDAPRHRIPRVCLRQSEARSRNTFAGTPATTAKLGTSSVTTAPAPT